MVCGVCLGTFLLICLVQAEHVCCLWATQAQSSQRQNGNGYVGFSQQESGLGRLGGSYPQNQLRQASAHSSSFSTDTAVGSGYSQGLSGSGYTQTASQPAKSGYPSVRVVQSSLLSKPNWRAAKQTHVNAQKVPKKLYFGLSTSIASGSSLSKYNKNQNDRTDIGKRRTWPTQQDKVHASKYMSSSSASIQSPSKSFYHQSAAQKAPSAAAAGNYGQRDSSMKSSTSMFGAGAAVPQMNPVRTQTSASAPARRVSSRRSSKPSHFSSPQNEQTGYNPSQTQAGRYQSKLFHATGGNNQGSYKPASTSNMASKHVSYSQSYPESNKPNAQVNFQPHRFEKPTSQGLSYQPGYSATGQIPSSQSSLQTSWSSRNPAQGAHGSDQLFAPTRTYSIPERFGGFAIRRLRDPADQMEVSVRKPQQTYTAPPLHNVPLKPQVQTVHQKSKWMRFRPSGTVGAAGVHG